MKVSEVRLPEVPARTSVRPSLSPQQAAPARADPSASAWWCSASMGWTMP